MYTKILNAYSPNTTKYFPRILHRRLNTFLIFSEYAERMENTQKDIFTLIIPDEVNGTEFRENQMAYVEQITNLIFWLFLT